MAFTNFSLFFHIEDILSFCKQYTKGFITSVCGKIKWDRLEQCTEISRCAPILQSTYPAIEKCFIMYCRKKKKLKKVIAAAA